MPYPTWSSEAALAETMADLRHYVKSKEDLASYLRRQLEKAYMNGTQQTYRAAITAKMAANQSI